MTKQFWKEWNKKLTTKGLVDASDEIDLMLVEARKQSRKQTLEEVLKWLPDNVKVEDLYSDASVEGITFRLKKWLEKELSK